MQKNITIGDPNSEKRHHSNFFQKAWAIIKGDVIAAIHKLFLNNGRGFGRLNQALITLLPKKSDSCQVKDFRPISLVDSAPKLASKLLASRLSRRMGEIVSVNQSAFIKGRCIHDTYLLVRQVAHKVFKSKEHGLFLNLEISRAFDSLSWPFLFEVMRAKGFVPRWLHWVATILATSSTKIIVNGVPGRTIHHARGLRQGDPISPLLFVVAMDALSRLFVKASGLGVISNLRGISPTQRLSLYADDVVSFLQPPVQDWNFVRAAFEIFGEAAGLRINYNKTTAVLIRGSDEDRQRVMDMLHCEMGHFPCKYLGIQLAIRKLTRADWQPLLDQT